MRLRRLGALGAGVGLLVTAACSSSDGSKDGDPAAKPSGAGSQLGDNMMDVRVTPPESADPALDFATTELQVPPGEERQWCVFMKSPPEDLYIQSVQQFQGDGGHHAILLTTEQDQPDGAVVDCTQAEDMADYSLTLLPLDLPAGYAQLLPANTSMVFQSHYVNTTADTLLTQDVVRLHTVSEADVEVPAAPFATHHYDVDVPPLGTGDITFDCEIDRDADIITVGGHMHEEGASFKLELQSAGGGTETIYEVPQWVPDYRDTPPIDVFVENPVPIAPGDVLTTTCTWNNTRDEQIVWPSEMCASFGLIAGTFEPYECNLGYR